MKKFSQNDEERIILEYFKDYNEGTFLSIGENDGETFSNVRALALKGFCGVMVEPSPKAFRKLKALYEGSKKGCFYLYECALGNTNGKIILHESGALLGTEDVGLVSSLDKEEIKRFSRTVQYEEVEVKVFRWKTFLNRLYTKNFDMISIDIEGLEVDVLKQMDLTDVKLICVETNGNLEKKKVLDDLLQGFKVIYTSPENLIYVR